MSHSTVFGSVVFRAGSSRISESQTLMLKDNLCLEPVFSWLKRSGVRSVGDLKDPGLIEKLETVEFEDEVKWAVDEKAWMLTFHCSRPSNGDFAKAVPRYLELFKDIATRPYSQDDRKLQLLSEVRQLREQIAALEEQLRE